MAEEEYAQLFRRIRPEIIGLAKKNSEYWMKKYNPVIGRIQDRILRGEQVAVQGELAEERSHAAGDAYHGNQWGEQHRLCAGRLMEGAVNA